MSSAETKHTMGRIFCLILLAALLTACAPNAGTMPDNGFVPPASEPSISLQDCNLTAPGLSVQVAAKCAFLTVPENRADPSARTLNIRVAVVKAQSSNPAPDPLFLLAGGPGQAAGDAYLPLLPALEDIAFKHDLVLVDQRGTGHSNPLRCENTSTQEISAQAFPTPEEIRAAFAACIPQLDADTRFYTSADFAADLEDVRQALGYGQIDLLGVSYGTRAAQAYLKAYPQNVRAVVLDSVVPPGWYIGESLRADSQRAIEAIFARCASEAGCSAAFPDLSGDLNSLIDRLNAVPEQVVLPDPTSGGEVRVAIDGKIAAVMLRLISYSSDYSALLPWLLHTAAGGDLRPLAAQYLILNQSGVTGGIETGLFYAVLCAEDIPFISSQGESGTFFFYDPLPGFRAACSAYPPNPQPTAAEFPPGLDIPALIISGGSDPVTPPENGAALAALLPNSRHVILPGMAHGNVAYGCLPNLVTDLLESADPTALDLSCTGRIAPPPFFTSAIGPEP
jgi:pimeloyl-ACP methyl ester carboxylesterase